MNKEESALKQKTQHAGDQPTILIVEDEQQLGQMMQNTLEYDYRPGNDGSIFPVQLGSDVVRNAEGKAIAIVTTCEDITERKKEVGRIAELLSRRKVSE